MDERPDASANEIRPDCPECHARAGLHALSCSRYREEAPPDRLTDAELSLLRAQPPYEWTGWPPDDDQGLPVVEIRQDHLAALIAEVEAVRGGWLVLAAAMRQRRAGRPLKRHRVEAWVNELGKLEVEIPSQLGGVHLEAFLTEHPEQRDRIEAAEKRSAALRHHAETVIGEVYGHFSVGSPSRWGLTVSLRGLAAHLDTADRR